MNTMKRIRLATLAGALTLSMPPAFGQSQAPPPAPVDRAEILGRLASGYSPSFVAYLVRVRGVSFSVSANFIDEVARAGGRGVLVDELPHATSPNSGEMVSGDSGPLDHLAKCAELRHTGDLENARVECRAAISENPTSRWPVRATMQTILSTLAEMGPSLSIDDATKKELRDLQQKFVSNWPPDPPALRPRDAVFAATDPAAGPDELESVESGRIGLEAGELNSVLFAIPDFNETDSGPDADPNRYEPQLEQMLKVVQAQPELASNHLQLASLYDPGLRQFENARREILEAIRLEPDFERGHIQLAFLYRQHKDMASSLAEIQTVAEIAPQGIEEHLALAASLQHAGRNAEAIAEFKSILARRPAQPYASSALVDLYVDQKDLPSAIEELRRSLKIESASYSDEAAFVSANMYEERRLAELLKETRDLEGAGEVYQNLIRFAPDDSGLHNDYGNVLLDLGRCDQAIGEYNESLRLDPSGPEPHHNTGMCLQMSKDFDGAIREYRLALERDPNSPHTRTFLATALAQKGDLAAAEKEFREMMENSPKDPQPHVDYALALSIVKQDAKAITELKEALELNPNFAMAQNNLAWIYATSEDLKLRNATEALRLALLAVKNSEAPNPAYLDTLAEAQLLNENAAEALKTELEAAKLVPAADPEMQKRLAHFREAAGQSAPLKN